jgi:hypothetical protein
MKITEVKDTIKKIHALMLPSCTQHIALYLTDVVHITDRQAEDSKIRYYTLINLTQLEINALEKRGINHTTELMNVFTERFQWQQFFSELLSIVKLTRNAMLISLATSVSLRHEAQLEPLPPLCDEFFPLLA